MYSSKVFLKIEKRIVNCNKVWKNTETFEIFSFYKNIIENYIYIILAYIAT